MLFGLHPTRESDGQEQAWPPWPLSPSAQIANNVLFNEMFFGELDQVPPSLPDRESNGQEEVWPLSSLSPSAKIANDVLFDNMSFGELDQIPLLPPDSSQIGSDVSTPSSGTVSSGTVVGQLSAEPDIPFQIVQYSHTKRQKRTGYKDGQKHGGNFPVTKRRSRGSRAKVLKTAPKTSIKRDASGKIAGTVTIFGFNQVARTPVSLDLQLATSITRRVGACSRCRQQRLRCDMPENVYEPCGRCMKLVSNFYMRRTTNFHYQPCMRVNILDLRLHRKGPTIYDDLHVWVHGKQELLKFQPNTNTQLLFLTQGFGEGTENALTLIVSRFQPGPGDRTAYFWTDPSGQPRSMEMPPYFISDMEAARQNIREFLRNARSSYIETLLGDSNPIVVRTFQAALTYSTFGQSKLISEALDTWVAARFIESHWHIFCGGAMIGLEVTTEPGHPYNGFIPVTPIMDTQLDDLVIRDLLTPLNERLLKRLKAKIGERKRENWLEIYLAMFIIMSNVGWILKDMIAMTTWKGLKAGSRGGTLTQGYIHGCKTLLAYFHFVCAGSIPLSVTFAEPGGSSETHHGMTRDQILYLRSVQQEIALQSTKLSKWKDLSMYDDEIYWCYQMLCPDWRGDIPHPGEIDDYTEDDFLSSSRT